MKNGFTLAELIGVVALLGIIAMITVPAVDRSLNKGKSELEDTQKAQLTKGIRDYLAEHPSDMPDNIGDKYCKNISELQSLGYLPDNLKNPKDGSDYSLTLEVCVVKSKDNNYTYSVE